MVSELIFIYIRYARCSILWSQQFYAYFVVRNIILNLSIISCSYAVAIALWYTYFLSFVS